MKRPLIALIALSAALIATPASATPSGDGLLLRAKAGMDESGTPFTTGTCASIIGAVDYWWGEYAPGSCPEEEFTTYTSGSIEAPATGFLWFCIISDDGTRLVVNGKVLADGLTTRHPEDYSCNYISPRGLRVEQGAKYPIEIFHIEDHGGAVLSLRWGYSNDSEIAPESFSVVPQEYLYSTMTAKTFGFVRDMTIAPQDRNRADISGVTPGRSDRPAINQGKSEAAKEKGLEKREEAKPAKK